MKRLLILVFFSIQATAQLHEVAQTTMVLPNEILETIEVLTVEDEVLLVDFQESILGRDKNVMLIKYNAQLEQVWTAFCPVNRLYQPVSYLTKDDVFYYLTRELESKKVQLIMFQMDSGHWSVHDFELLTNMSDISFEMFNGNVLIGGTYNYKPVIEMHTLSDKTAKVLPEIYYKNNTLGNMMVNPYRNQLYVFSQVQNKCQFQVTIFDALGKLVSRHLLGDKKHKVQGAEVRFGLDGEPFIVGAYNSSCTDLSEGFYTGSLDEPNRIKYHAISDLRSFNDLLPVKRREKRLLKKEKGKSSPLRQRLIFSIPFSGSTGYIASAEVYTQQTTTTYQVPMNQGTTGRLVSRRDVLSTKDYRVSNLLLVENSFDGQVIQDRMVKMTSNNFNHIEPQVAYIVKDEAFYGILPNKDDLVYVNMSSDTPDVQRFKIMSSEKFNVSSIDAKLISWTPQYALVYGTADAFFNNNTASFTRELFFLKKIEIK